MCTTTKTQNPAREIAPGDLVDATRVEGISGRMSMLRAIVTHVGQFEGKRTISAVGLDPSSPDSQGNPGVAYFSQTTLPANLIDTPGGDAHAAFLTQLRPLITSARTAARLDAMFFVGAASDPTMPTPAPPTNLPEAYRTQRYDGVPIIGFDGFEVRLPEGGPARLSITPRGQNRGGSLGTTPAPFSRLTTPANLPYPNPADQAEVIARETLAELLSATGAHADYPDLEEIAHAAALRAILAERNANPAA